MRGWGVPALLAASLAGQPAAPIGVVQGALLARDTGASGKLTVRGRDNQVYSFEYDGKTLVEKDGQAVRTAELAPGDNVEILSDVGASPRTRYARTVKTIPAPTQRKRSPARRRARPSLPPEDPFPRGALSFTGAVTSVTADRLILHMRDGRDQTILLRTDTRFLEKGEPVERGRLPVNAHVFVRAGPALGGQVEAFQVVWGGILKPE